MKNPNGFGSTYKLSGNRRNPWVARKTDGWNDKGHPIYKIIGYYPTQKDAMIALAEYNKNPFEIESSKITFSELYERWSAVHFEKVSKSNVQGVKAAYKLCDKVKNMKIADIRLDHLQDIVDSSGKNTPTLKKLKVMLGLMYDYGVMHELIPENKRAMIKYLDVNSAGNPNSHTKKPFTRKQVEMFWNLKDSHPLASTVLILIYTGCRIGELLNLKKEDVHIDEKWFYVRKSKTPSGVREVPIADKIMPIFKEWFAKDSEYLICRSNGQQVKYSSYLKSFWIPLMNSLNMRDYTPHCGRHTCITFLTEAGVDGRIIKQIEGHKGDNITESVYTHINLPSKLEAINRI